MSAWRCIISDGRGCGIERASQAGGECSWCGMRKRTMFRYRAEGGRFLSGLMGEGRVFCNLACFRAFQ